MTSPVHDKRAFEFIGPHREALKESFSELDFDGVVMRVFPLRANLNRLTSFCNRYLNMKISPEIAHFEPAAPYVLMMVVNYGRMADSTSNMGWVAQNEILFAVPLAGSWNQDGQTIREPAIVSPFIFVDNAWSIATGREVYGWPKMPVWLEPGLNTWLQDPRSPRRLMTLKTTTLAEFYAGRRAKAQTLLEIEQEPARIVGQMPPNLDYLLNPLVSLPKIMLETMAAAPDYMQSLGRAFQMGVNSDLPALLSGIFESLSADGPALYGNTINLKQFRSSEPGNICYQALVNSRMMLKRFNAGGLMGSLELLRGDPTGGFSLYLHDLPAFPIVESLGLVVERTVDRQGVPVALLKPLLPFWASLDMSYRRGRRICYRTSTTDWRAWEGEEAWHKEAKDSPPVAEENSTETEEKKTKDHPFNTTLGAAVEAVQGPFDFYNSTIRILPIPARSAALLRLVPDLKTLDVHEDLIEIQPIAASLEVQKYNRELPPDSDISEYIPDTFVFLVVTSCGEMSAAENDIGWWAQNEVSLVFGIRLTVPFEIEDDKAESVSLHWICWPYMFADSTIAVTEGREVLGLPSAYANISKGVDPWLEPDRPLDKRHLLTVSTMDYPSIGYGQQAREHPLLEIARREPAEEHPCSSSAALDRFKNEFFEQGSAQSLRLFNLSLKEFRDEEQPGRPCYQSLVAFDRTYGRWTEDGTKKRSADIEFEPLTGEYEVTFHSTPSWPLIEKLGLVHDRVRSESGTPVGVCKVIKPFLIRSDIRADLAIDLIHRRVDTRRWEDSQSDYFVNRQKRWSTPKGERKGKNLEDLFDFIDPSQLVPLLEPFSQLVKETSGTTPEPGTVKPETPTSTNGGEDDPREKKDKGHKKPMGKFARLLWRARKWLREKLD
ncbi:MAG: hypothetical protein ACE5GX_07505 [Thermoanaerobaculia bacterium]